MVMSQHERQHAPLKGLIFCCTAVEPDVKFEIDRAINAMGGTHKAHLMSDVVYLIVGDRDTDKYRFCVEGRADIVFLRPSILPSIYRRWVEGEDIDVIEEMNEGRLKVFEGLTISITRITYDPDRLFLMNLITSNGGVYNPDLNKKVTHLIAPAKAGKKYEYARKWRLPIVHPAWLTKSVERGAALEEKYFDLDLAPDEIGVGACSVLEELKISRAIAASKKRAVKSTIWNSIIGNLPEPKAAVEKASAWDVEDDAVTGVDPGDSRRHADSIPGESEHSKPSSPPPLSPSTSYSSSDPLFSGLVFDFNGFDPKQLRTLEQVVTSHRGSLHINTLLPVSYYIINSKLDQKPDYLPSGSFTVTEWMIERSLYKKTLCNDIWGTFVGLPYGIPTMKGVQICLSGFSGIELLHLERLVPMLGAELCPVLTPTRHVLVSTRRSQRLRYALKWNIPVVNELWLWECAITGKIALINDSKWLLDGRVHAEIGKKETESYESQRNDSSMNESVILDGKKETDSDQIKRNNSSNDDTASLDVSINRGLSAKTSSGHPARLIGRAAVSNLIAHAPVQHTSVETLALDTMPEPQISYLDPETLVEKQQLLRSLGEVEGVNNMKLTQEMTAAVDLKSVKRQVNSPNKRNLRRRVGGE